MPAEVRPSGFSLGVQNNAHPTLCAAKGCALSFVDMPWQASNAYKVGQEILILRTANNTLYINVVTVAGDLGSHSSSNMVERGGCDHGEWHRHLSEPGRNNGYRAGELGGDPCLRLACRIVDSNGNVEPS